MKWIDEHASSFTREARMECRHFVSVDLSGRIEKHVYEYWDVARDDSGQLVPGHKYEFYVVDGRRFDVLEDAKRAVNIRDIIDGIAESGYRVRVRRWQKGGPDIFGENMSVIDVEILLEIAEQVDQGHNPAHITAVSIMEVGSDVVVAMAMATCSAMDMALIKRKGELKQKGFWMALSRAYHKLNIGEMMNDIEEIEGKLQKSLGE